MTLLPPPDHIRDVDRPLDQCGHGAARQGIGDVFVSIAAFAAEGHEQIAGLDCARVGLHAQHRPCAVDLGHTQPAGQLGQGHRPHVSASRQRRATAASSKLRRSPAMS